MRGGLRGGIEEAKDGVFGSDKLLGEVGWLLLLLLLYCKESLDEFLKLIRNE